MQSFVLQAVCWLGGSVIAFIGGFIGGVFPLAGLICIPVACIFGSLPIVALIYGTIGGIQVNQGQEFKYWLIGDWVQNSLLK
jgi:hypothetical protein